LTRGAKKLWTSLAAELEPLDASGALMLDLLCQTWDRREIARAAIEKEGAVMDDRFGQKKVSPHSVIERDASLQILRCYHALGFDLAPEDAR